VDGLVIERRLRYINMVIVCYGRSVYWYPRGGGGLSVGVKISARRRQIPSTESALEVVAITKDSSRGNDHPNDNDYPMAGRGL